MNAFLGIVKRSMAALVLSAFCWSAHATILSWNLSYLLPDSTGGGGYTTASAATVSLADVAGGMQVSVDNTMNPPDGTFLTRLWLYDSSITDKSVVPYNLIASDGYGEALKVPATSLQGYPMNLQINFNTSGQRLNYGDTATFLLKDASTSTFGTLVTGNAPNPDSPAMAMLQALGGLSFHYVVSTVPNVKTYSTVPEPSTYLLLLAGLAPLGLAMRRRNRA